MISGIGAIDSVAVTPVSASRPAATGQVRRLMGESAALARFGNATSVGNVSSEEFERAIAGAVGSSQQAPSFSGFGDNLDDYISKAREMAERRTQDAAQEAAYLEAGKRARPMLDGSSSWQAATAQQAGTALMPGYTAEGTQAGTQPRERLLDSDTRSQGDTVTTVSTTEAGGPSSNSGSMEIRSAEHTFLGSSAGSGDRLPSGNVPTAPVETAASSQNAQEQQASVELGKGQEQESAESRKARVATAAYQKVFGTGSSNPTGTFLSMAV